MKLIRNWQFALLLLFPLQALGPLQAWAAPGDVLFQEQFNNTADLTADWTVEIGMRVNPVSGDPSPALSMEGRRFPRFATSRTINTEVPGANLSFWVQRGFDTQAGNCLAPASCSEFPENGDNIRVEYLSDANNWVTLATYNGGGTPAEQFTFSEPLPSDALHNGFRIRFVYIGNNTNAPGWDLWHVDNVVIQETVAAPPATVPAPIADWRMDEDSWDSTADEVTDSSGNGFAGTAFGTSTTDDGFICNAGDFRPTGNTDYLSMNAQAMNGLRDFSISTWVQTSNSRSQALVSASDGRRHNELIMWWVNSSTFRPWVKNSQNGGQINAPINDGDWHHLVWTRNGSQNCLYVDGTQQGSCVSRPTAALSIAAGGLIIGQEQDRLGGGFDRNQDWEGKIDEVLIFNSALNRQQVSLLHSRQANGNNWDGSARSCSGARLIDHYHIQASDGVSCQPVDVRITPHDANHNPIDGQGTSLALSTSTGRGTFSANPVIIPGGSSFVDVQLSYRDLNGNSSEIININVTDGLTSEDPAEDPDIEMSLSGLRFIHDNGSVSTTLPSQVAAVPSTDNLFVEAIQVDSNADNPATAACVGVYTNGQAVPLNMGGECINPGSCQLNRMQINGIAIPASNNGNDRNTVNLTFNANSRAAISVNYADVGAIRFHAEDPARQLSGTSNAFVVRPHTMVVTAAESTGSPVINGLTTPLPAPRFVPAGTDFRLVVESRNANGNLTPNYGNEISAETVAVNFATLLFPTGAAASNGSLAGGTFTNTGTGGEFHSTTANWSEVGVFTVTADVADGDYLGAGGVASLTTSDNIGRFYPADFALSGTPQLNTFCEASSANTGTFSYLSQPNLRFNASIIARNALGNTVSNYDNTDLNYLTGNPDYHAENADNGIDLAARVSLIPLSPVQWDNGVYLLDDIPGQLNRAATPDGPFTAMQFSVNVSDPDGATLVATDLDQNPASTGDCSTTDSCTTASLGASQLLRYGRAIMENASGPETAPLPVIFGLQQWNGTVFENATTDSCNTLAFPAITFDTHNPITNPQPVNVGTGISNGQFNAIGSNATVISGGFDLSFSAPGSTGEFPVNVNLVSYPWLQFDWNQDGNFFNDSALPEATIRFGSYRGHDRVIYWQERF